MMGFYDLNKEARVRLTEEINQDICASLRQQQFDGVFEYCSDEDTYIRKVAYIALGKIYADHPMLHATIFKLLDMGILQEDFKVRQTIINAAGEIGKRTFDKVRIYFDKGLFDTHHSPRNAVIGSVKKMGEVNPVPVLKWAREYLHHPDKEVRREICHGIELRGRTHPQDILPLLNELENDPTARVRNTLVHVLGQIAYKKGCLAIVIEDLKRWGNIRLVDAAIAEIIDVHDRYKNFAAMSQDAAITYIQEHFIRTYR